MLLEGETASTLLGAAVQMAFSLGLHRKLGDAGLHQSEVEARRNVFWVLYLFEKMTSFRMGRPSMINDKDIEIDPPGDTMPIETQAEASTFSHHVRLMFLETDIHNELYSVRGRSHLASKRSMLISDFDQRLQQWLEDMPSGARRENLASTPAEQVSQAIMLHFAYFNCVNTLHRLSIYNALAVKTGQDESKPQESNNQPQAFASHAKCLQAARNSIELLQSLDHSTRLPRDSLMRHALYYPLSAFLSLFVNTLQNPHALYALSDLQLLDFIPKFLSPAFSGSESSIPSLVLEVVQKLRDIATNYVAEAQVSRPTMAMTSQEETPSQQIPWEMNMTSGPLEDGTSATQHNMQDLAQGSDQDRSWMPTQQAGYIFSSHQASQPDQTLTTAHPPLSDVSHLPSPAPLQAHSGPNFEQTIPEAIGMDFVGTEDLNAVYDPFVHWTFDWDMANMWSNRSEV
ncbi:hypothetical protein LTS07_005955 [Exophiala sideris]|uniref:Xylanolytic transcriptional activator regulatory domain-containing protein n=1 Tax=Exophiala sideris TaxID=1016849 RepID=A0ABR0J7A9_9EURO|nr:hypothetical protein LTS07_005955 [Exophiala sideris]KAK5058123.1 hypothetical protein LTR69_007120 [Exophiala sideris]KAK5182082.1 hypothetical protein LTR44_005683 [Eurotiomycetes sp. CCFEE 6388]